MGSLFSVNLVYDRSSTPRKVNFTITVPRGVEIRRKSDLTGSATYDINRLEPLRDAIGERVDRLLGEITDKRNAAHHENFYNLVKTGRRIGGGSLLDVMSAGAVAAVDAMYKASQGGGVSRV